VPSKELTTFVSFILILISAQIFKKRFLIFKKNISTLMLYFTVTRLNLMLQKVDGSAGAAAGSREFLMGRRICVAELFQLTYRNAKCHCQPYSVDFQNDSEF